MRLCALIVQRWFAMRVPVLLVLLAGWPAGAAEPPALRRPNVLLVMCDDLRPALHCYGDATASSPNIDALAARGGPLAGLFD